MGAYHRRAISSPDVPSSYLATLARATGLSPLPTDPDSVVDLGFAPAVATDDSSNDDSSDDPDPDARHATASTTPLPSTSATPPPCDGSPARRRKRSASSSLVGRKGVHLAGGLSHQRLDYLDLPPSLPLSLALAGDSVMAQLAALEARLASLAPDSGKVDAVLAHLSAARDQLRLLLARIPDATSLLPRPTMPAMQDLSARMLTEAGAQLTSLKEHLEAANEAVSNSFPSVASDFHVLKLKTTEAMRGMELCLAEVGTGAKRVVTKAAWTAEELEARIYAAALDLAAEGRRLICYSDLPFLWRNNEYILTGYRFIPLQRWPRLMYSTFQWHNESGNVWTHILGIVLCLAAPAMFDAPASSTEGSAPTPMDKIISWVYIGAAVKCMALSVSWHVMAGCSNFHTMNLFACVDYTGIAWLISASVWTVAYNLFYLQPNIVFAYITTTFLLAVVCTVVPFIPWFNERKNKKYRIMIFVALAGVGALPVTHAAYAHGIIKTVRYLSPVLPSIAAYVGGLVFYATHFPESWRPGRFDYLGHAHQIWHMAIVLAVLLHYRCVQGWHAQRAAYADPTTPLTGPNPSFLGSDSIMAVVTTTLAGTISYGSKLFPFLPQYRDNQALLTTADATVHGFRQTLGSIGGGAVGRAYQATTTWVNELLS